MASSDAEYRLTNSSGSVTYQNSLTGANAEIPDVGNGDSQAFSFYFADTGIPSQTMPLGTTVNISSSAGTLQGLTSFTVTNNNLAGFSRMDFFIIQEAGAQPQTAVLTIDITSPSGVVTSLNRSMELL